SGMFGDEIDGAVVGSDGAYYFRSGDQVLRYEPTSREPSPGYPRTVPAESGSHWLGFLPS
ncbi:hemopexin repeat-containing protein, partial [Haliangium sp. UPWRP_2]|uniref:hemopexin repeat-containing protein n=1 Tax=Haliangium sp. UPWRP_2 TaxID=1931276 RepID=UPI0018ED299E